MNADKKKFRSQWLSQGVEKLVARIDPNRAEQGPPWDVVIVGSGYGGAVAAARLAGCGVDGRTLSVCVLERGQEYLPGMFPQRFDELAGHVRFSTLKDPRPQGKRAGLFDLRIAPDVSVLAGSGLGGGSLINAGVMAEPRHEVFNAGWPQALRYEHLEEHFESVRDMLGAAQTTVRAPKFESLVQLGRELQPASKELRCHVAVTFEPGRMGMDGVEKPACLHCGDCFVGCNHGAKNTLDTNYLALARKRGAEIFTGATVLGVEKVSQAQGWNVLFTFTHEQVSRTDRGPFRLRCRKVILAAGSLGSTEILLRSSQSRVADETPRQVSRLQQTGKGPVPAAGRAAVSRPRSLEFSALLGHRFSTNGDMFAAGYKLKHPAYSAPHESKPPAERGVGPTITGMIDLRGEGEKPLRQQIVIQEMAVPAALRRLFAETVTTVGALYEMAASRQSEPPHDPLAIDEATVDRTALFAMMGHDGAEGRLQLQAHEESGDPTDGRVFPRWSNAGASEVFGIQIKALEENWQKSGLGGFVIPNPLWRPLPASLQRMAFGPETGALITVHPLGGCPMGDHAGNGVTDHLGQVFDPAGKAGGKGESALHSGLIVLDGSIIPTSLGINPALTIAAVAERAICELKKLWGISDFAGQDAVAIPPRPQADPAEIAAREDNSTKVEIREELCGEIRLSSYSPELYAALEVVFDTLPIPHFRNGDQAAHPVRNATLRLYDSESSERRLVGQFILEGTVRLFEREPSTRRRRKCRALPAYLHNRSMHDLRRGFVDRISRFWREFLGQTVRGTSVGLCNWVKTLWVLLDYAGEVWQLDYTFTVREAVIGNQLVKDDELRGLKRITYSAKANPWRQLSEIELYRKRPGKWRRHLGRLTLDLEYFALQEHPLLRITKQSSHPQALADLISFGLYLARLVLRVHLLSFKPQDLRRPEEEANLSRLFPGALKGAPTPQIRQLSTLRSSHGDVRIRLTRYQSEGQPRALREPLVLIHGFGASGSTFAHPLIKPNLVQCLLDERFDVWVVDLRTSVAMGTARHPWELDEVAKTDVVSAIDEVLFATGAERVSVIAHCIGAAMFSYAVLSGRLKGKVRAAVLSQVGPVTRFSAANVFRAYVASYLAQYVPARVFDIRPSPVPGMLEVAVDRLLATYPYDDSEWYHNNPWLGQRVPHAALRRRADAIWGQLFEQRNVDPDVVDKLDELLGQVNVSNLAQTMYYALRGALTIEQGLGSALDKERLQQYWTFPTRFLFGTANRVFDRDGVTKSCAKLTALLQEHRSDGRGGEPPFDCRLIKGFGHQDVLIGSEADRTVFRNCIVPFLNKEFGPLVPRAQPQGEADAFAPRLGPVVGWLRDDPAGSVLVRLLVAPPVELPGAAPVSEGPELGQGDPAVVIADAPGWPVVCEIEFPAIPPGGLRDHISFRPRNQPRHSKVQFASEEAAGSFALTPEVLRARDRLRAVPDEAGLCFALASCQYPAGLLDRVPATQSFVRLAERLSSPQADCNPQLLFLMGDQIYADETAGLFVASGSDERYTHAHERLFKLDPVQRVVSRLPTYMMLDDHELWDNWEPPRSDHLRGEEGTGSAGLAFQRYQWNSGPGPVYQALRKAKRSFWYEFRPGGFPVFFMDTRTERDRRVERIVGGAPERTRLTANAQIVSDEQWKALESWLSAMAQDPATTNAPKFIVSASVVFPWSSAFDDDESNAARFDGWDGYPASLKRLLGFIAHRGVQSVVFLSGDHHASLVARIDLRADNGDRSVTAHSIVSSALYAPYPFANVKARDLALEATGTWEDSGGRAFEYSVSTLPPRGAGALVIQNDGYGVVSVQLTDGAWLLNVEFDTSAGPVRYDAQQLARFEDRVRVP